MTPWPCKNFTPAELSCKCSCGLMNPAVGFLTALQRLRNAFGHPMPINSACRCSAHNKKVGGKPKSYHIGDSTERAFGFCAVDVGISIDHPLREDFIEIAFKSGWSVGMHARFVHVDLRSAYDGSKQVVFDY